MNRSQTVGALPLVPCDTRGSSGITGAFAKDQRSAAIPESGVRYPCIPHPFATNFLSSYPSRSPFDLHALATPPAFVLSQDQTLQFNTGFQMRPDHKDPSAGNRRRLSIMASVRMKACQHTSGLFCPPTDGLHHDRTAGLGQDAAKRRRHAQPSHSHDDKPVHLSKSEP